MKMIAEGVENATQAEFLRSRGCTDMQGFHFYKPVSVLELEEIILK
jgi:EAL domain-containing protein (putative c-di-GMP-specific phosphodiesterase class I)